MDAALNPMLEYICESRNCHTVTSETAGTLHPGWRDPWY